MAPAESCIAGNDRVAQSPSTVPARKMPPKSEVPVLPLTVQLVSVVVPSVPLPRPPPRLAELPLMVQLGERRGAVVR